MAKKVGKMRRTSLSPEEILARAFRAKCRFRAAVRFVMQNLYWLEDVEDQELGDDVQKNIMLLTKRKEKKSLLTLEDKALLNKPAEYREDHEKLHLFRVIGGLKCFRRYPADVKSKLAGVSYFVYFGPGRTIVRQGDEAHALYFLITGDVHVTQEMFDGVVNEYVKVDLGIMGPGGMFGEVSLLHDIPRTATVTSLSHCEMLCLKKSDFNVVLKETVKAQWDAVQNSMMRFSYFDEWDEIAIRECCILAKTKMYNTDQTILGDGYGFNEFVYFVLKGRCRVVEHLHVITTIKKGVKHYELYVPSVETDSELEEQAQAAVSTQSLTSSGNKSGLNKSSEKINKSTSVGSESESKHESSIEEEREGEREREEHEQEGEHENENEFEEGMEEGYEEGFGEEMDEIESMRTASLAKKSIQAHTDKSADRIKNLASTSSVGGAKRDSKALKDKSSEKVDKSATSKTIVRDDSEEYLPIYKVPTARRVTINDVFANLPRNVETHFMQVCIFNPTATFCIGENFENRRIIAMVHTECLLIPRYWLVQKNKGNIWNRIKQFLNSRVPSSKKVFKDFVNNKQWIGHRKRLVNNILENKSLTNDNVRSNVPYSIRIHQEIDY